jgi:hypothetical protein
MAKTRRSDPTLARLVRAVDDALDAGLPIALSVHGTRFDGELVSESAYFAALTGDNPLLGALDPKSELADKDYADEHGEAAGTYLHMWQPEVPGSGSRSVWRIRQDTVDAWSLSSANRREEEPGVMARLFGRSDV